MSEIKEIQSNKRSTVFIVVIGTILFSGLAVYYTFPTATVGALVIVATIASGGVMVLKLLNDKQKEL